MSSCDAGTLKPVEDAIAQLLEKTLSLSPESDSEMIPITEALGRVLAAPQTSSIDVPPQDNSAVDGYVVSLADVKADAAVTLDISQRIPAGAIPSPLEQGTAGRIFTGAFVPEGGSAVVMQEDCIHSGETVTIPAGVRARQNIRPQGQDIKSGQLILAAGQRLRAQDLGLLASIGIGEVLVFRKLKAAIISTGDELLEPGEPNAPGKIYNSNRYTLKGLLAPLLVETLDFGIIEDSYAATESALKEAAQTADVIFTSGGVSVGEEDHIKAAIENLGEINLWRLAIKPGKPLAFGEVCGTPIIGLPGNPVAVFVTFAILGRPWLLKSQGASRYRPIGFKLPANFSIDKGARRQEYLRVRVEAGRMEKFNNQSSGVLSSTSWADGLAIVPQQQTIQAGDLLEFLPFSELLN